MRGGGAQSHTEVGLCTADRHTSAGPGGGGGGAQTFERELKRPNREPTVPVTTPSAAAPSLYAASGWYGQLWQL